MTITLASADVLRCLSICVLGVGAICGLGVEDAALALGVPFLPEALGLENWLDHWLF